MAPRRASRRGAALLAALIAGTGLAAIALAAPLVLISDGPTAPALPGGTAGARGVAATDAATGAGADVFSSAAAAGATAAPARPRGVSASASLNPAHPPTVATVFHPMTSAPTYAQAYRNGPRTRHVVALT